MHFPASEFLSTAGRSELSAYQHHSPAFILNRRESIDAVIAAELAADRDDEDDEDDGYDDDIGPEVYYGRQTLPSYLQQKAAPVVAANMSQFGKSRPGQMKHHQPVRASLAPPQSMLAPPPCPLGPPTTRPAGQQQSAAAANHGQHPQHHQYGAPPTPSGPHQPTLLPQLLAAAPLTATNTAGFSQRPSSSSFTVGHQTAATVLTHHDRVPPHSHMAGPPPPLSCQLTSSSSMAATPAATLSHLMLSQVKVTCQKTIFPFEAVLWIRNDLFRIPPRIFRVPDSSYFV